MSDFTIDCCSKTFLAKRYKVKPYMDGCIKEEFKRINCPVCGAILVIVNRWWLDSSTKKIEKETRKYKNRDVLEYYKNFDFITEILDKKVETGTASDSNAFYGKNNKRYDFNNKRRA